MTATEIEQALEPFRQVGTRRDHGGNGARPSADQGAGRSQRANFAIRSTPGEGTMVEITFPSTAFWRNDYGSMRWIGGWDAAAARALSPRVS